MLTPRPKPPPLPPFEAAESAPAAALAPGPFPVRCAALRGAPPAFPAGAALPALRFPAPPLPSRRRPVGFAAGVARAGGRGTTAATLLAKQLHNQKTHRRNELKKNPLKITVIMAVTKRTKDLQWRGKLKGRCSGTRGREGAPNLASHLASHLASLGARRAGKVKPAAQHSRSAAQPPPVLPQRVLSPSLKGENRSAAAARRPGLTESSVFGGKCGNASVCGRLLLYHWGTKPPALSGPSLCCGVSRAGG